MKNIKIYFTTTVIVCLFFALIFYFSKKEHDAKQKPDNVIQTELGAVTIEITSHFSMVDELEGCKVFVMKPNKKSAMSSMRVVKCGNETQTSVNGKF